MPNTNHTNQIQPQPQPQHPNPNTRRILKAAERYFTETGPHNPFNVVAVEHYVSEMANVTGSAVRGRLDLIRDLRIRMIQESEQRV